MISNNLKMIEPRKAEAYITLANNQKIKNILGWEPSHKIENYIKLRI